MAPNIYSDPEWLSMLNYVSLLAFPFALQTAIKLDVFEILAKHGKLSAQQIADLIPSPISNPRAPFLLDRLLHLLSTPASSPGLPPPLLAASISADPSAQTPVHEYSLLPASKYFLKDENGISLGGWMAHQASHNLDSYKHLDEVICKGGDGFSRAHGHQVSHHVAEHAAEMSLLMASATKLTMTQLLKVYNGFENARTVVDVGGCSGSAVAQILDKYPHLTGINLDQPHVVASGITHPRLKQMGGNMLESIPSADCIFMKHILHDWEDDDCLKVLANCQKAFGSEHGKVVVVDIYISSAVEDGVLPAHQFDVMMLASHGGKMRTIEEYRKLGQAAGFADVKVVCIVNELVVLEYLM